MGMTDTGTGTIGTGTGTTDTGEADDLRLSLAGLTFHGPLSEARAAGMTQRLLRANPGTVLDIGCGWGELMLRILEAKPGATGVGLDTDEIDLSRGRQNAEARGLTERVTFACESGVGTTRGPADLVLCVGASQALSDIEPPAHLGEALRTLRRLVTPGGRVLLGEGIWERPPTEDDLAGMWPGATPGEYHNLADLVDLVVDAGFRPAWIEQATLQEWDDFESGYQGDEEEWLAAHADEPRAAALRANLDEHRSYWLRGYRGLMGLAYLTLVPVT